MSLFAGGALVSFLGFAWQGRGRSWPYWLLGLAGFAAAIGREPSPLFLALFVVPTFAAARAALRARAADGLFGSLALSDVLVALALTARHADTAAWTLPAPGRWGAGAALVAAAAMVRLGGAAIGGDAAFRTLGWWQGLFLAWWAGPSAAGVLAAGALALGLLGLFGREAEGGSGPLMIAGGLALLVSAVGLDEVGVSVIGLAATAFALGERAVAMWVLVLLPLSAAAGVESGEIGPSAIFPLAVFPAAWAAAGERIGAAPVRGSGGRLSAAAAALLTLMFLSRWEWILYGAVLAAPAALWLTRMTPVLPEERPAPAPAPVAPWVSAAGWSALAATAALETRLVIIGLGTGFL